MKTQKSLESSTGNTQYNPEMTQMKQKKRILIVDDHQYVCLYIRDLLVQDGYSRDQITIINSPISFISSIKSDYYDLILLDERLGDSVTLNRVADKFREVFPDIEFPHEELVDELNLDGEDSVPGRYLLAVAKFVVPDTSVVMLTGQLVDSRLREYAKDKGALEVIPKYARDTDFEENPSTIHLESDLYYVLDSVFKNSQETLEISSLKTGKLHKNVTFRRFETTLVEHGREFSLTTFLETHIDQWPADLRVRGEILYYNPNQSLLEQITHVGFKDTLNTMQARPVRGDNFEGICAYTAFARQSVLSPNVKFDTRFRPVQKHDRTQSELAIPLEVGDELIGVLNFESDFTNAFDNDALVYFENVSSLIGQMLVHETLRKENKFLEDSIRRISGKTTKEDILTEAFWAILDLTGQHHHGCVLLPALLGNELLGLEVLINKDLELIEEGSVLSLEKLGIIKSAYEKPMTPFYWTPDDQSLRYVELTSKDIRSEWAIALGAEGSVAAVIDLESSTGAITERFQSAIKRLVAECSTMIRRLETRGELERESATRDALSATSIEVHNLKALLGILHTYVTNDSRELSDRTKNMFTDFQARLAETESLTTGFLERTRLIEIDPIIERSLEFAKQLGIIVQKNGATGSRAWGTESGLRWITENMILNTSQHTQVSSQRAYFNIEQDTNGSTLMYWDSGLAPDSIGELKGGEAPGKGMKGIVMICKKYGWTFDLHKAPNGSLSYKIELSRGTRN